MFTKVPMHNKTGNKGTIN